MSVKTKTDIPPAIDLFSGYVETYLETKTWEAMRMTTVEQREAIFTAWQQGSNLPAVMLARWLGLPVVCMIMAALIDAEHETMVLPRGGMACSFSAGSVIVMHVLSNNSHRRRSFMPNWGSAKLFNGDSRHLLEILSSGAGD